jgi:hypothetical protein
MCQLVICLKPTLRLLFVIILISRVCLAEGAPRPLNGQEVEMYRQIAHRIFDRVAALKDRYSHLALIDSTVRKEEAKDKLWIAYHYTHGMSWVPNPHYDPHKKGSRKLKSFSSDDGVELNLYFYEGEWMGQAAVRPVDIGAMKIVSFIEGDKTSRLAALEHDIGEIMSAEKASFKNQR